MKNLTQLMRTILFSIFVLITVTMKARGQDQAEMAPRKFSALENGRAFTRAALLKPCDCDQASFTFAPTRRWIAVDGFESKEDTTENNRRQRPSAAIVAVGGVLGGIAGFAAGGFLADGFTCDDEGEGCGRFILGVTVGEVIGVSLGAHLADKRQGNYLTTLLTSAGTGIVSFLVLGAIGTFDAEFSTGVTLVTAAFALQVATTVVVERATNRTPK